MCDFHNFGLIFAGQCTICLKGYNQCCLKKFWTEWPQRDQRSEKKFQTTLILVFKVIVQPSKKHFLTFSSETKIMKITHSASYTYCKNYWSVLWESARSILFPAEWSRPPVIYYTKKRPNPDNKWKDKLKSIKSCI